MDFSFVLFVVLVMGHVNVTQDSSLMRYKIDWTYNANYRLRIFYKILILTVTETTIGTLTETTTIIVIVIVTTTATTTTTTVY